MRACLLIMATAFLLTGCGDDSVPGTYTFSMSESKAASSAEGTDRSDGWYYQGQKKLAAPKSIELNADGSGALIRDGGSKSPFPKGAWKQEVDKILLNGKPFAVHSSGQLQIRMMLDASSKMVAPDDKSYKRNTPLIYTK